MNPWGALFIVLGILAIYIAIKGTQNRVYAFIFGHVPTIKNNTPFAPSAQGTPNAAPARPGSGTSWSLT